MKIEGVRRIWERYKFAAAILLIGAAVLLWPTGREPAEAGGETETDAWPPVEAAQLQREMERVLGAIQGVGEVRVLLTLHSDGERQLAQDTQVQYSGPTAAPESYARTAETVVVDAAAGREALVTRRVYPAYRGALVVCQGGDRPEVQLSVTEAVAVLTGLSSDRICVAKCP